MKEMIKMMVVLSLICGLAGVTLAALKEATAPTIEEQVLNYVQAPAIVSVLNDYDNNPIKDRKQFDINGRTVTVFPAMVQGSLKTVAFETSGKGYGGNIGVMVGFDLGSDTLSGIGITTLKETPGLGSRVVEHGYTTQFKGHSIDAVNLKKNGGDIEAVSGATISSTGTVSAIRDAIVIYNTLKTKFADSWS
ncbi:MULTISPECIES: RnfABCDGE type electron transport complex subunit G [unclassified Pseudodesulfovibrio]|uniref:RnfABCDGE type electron transport complex subunit G n=1 Tax=unclassified Pseudodesulfovibrio TaxID=2661612 RepID=UPI000FEBE952|nr:MULTISPECIES: RnfABCDGE type electron transport complex subunit G [unclassified Pseudodesulfovibrio]MCJ2164755.1 RnfABCDGE type electron transport complex subunit G [Pseudodesulfovibrio sp. S3-i]RWU04058.1 RnfABCDGE type electron transport complex subunit G [Pseudodesulfovibrio sp. S3]